MSKRAALYLLSGIAIVCGIGCLVGLLWWAPGHWPAWAALYFIVNGAGWGAVAVWSSIRTEEAVADAVAKAYRMFCRDQGRRLPPGDEPPTHLRRVR